MADNPERLSAERELKRRGRRRLIGAVTLGLLAFVFLPMFFDSEPKRPGQPDKTEISVQIPPRDGPPPLPAPAPATPAVTAVAPPVAAPEPAPPAEAAKVVAAPVPTAADTPPAKVAPPPEPAPKVAPAKESRKEAAAKVPADKPAAEKHAAEKKGFAVQIGAFSDADKIKESIARVKEAGLAAYTENVAVKTGKVTRVRAGPFETREKADAALARIKLSGGDGTIVPLKP